MEYGMNSTLKVSFTDIDTSLVEMIEFVFKQANKNEASAIKHVTWRKDHEVDTEVYTIDDDYSKFYIPFTKEETFKFEPKKKFYLDARVHYTDTFDNPKVPVVSIMMDDGLFGKEDNYA